MLTPYLRSQFVTKVLTSANGEQYEVVFLVALVNGEVKAQVVSAEPLAAPAGESLFLSLPKNDQKLVTFTPAGKGTSPSPFYNELFFFNSQPTRAPSF